MPVYAGSGEVRIGAKGIALVKEFESCRLEAYLPTPDDVPTIGWGSTKGVKLGDVWTQEQADAALLDDLEDAENCVNRQVKVPLQQEEFDALVSLVFNIGCGNFSGSTLLRKLNDSDYDGASQEFQRWCKQKGKVLTGLVRRRFAEAKLFNTDTA